jgi:hypothetical protein
MLSPMSRLLCVLLAAAALVGCGSEQLGSAKSETSGAVVWTERRPGDVRTPLRNASPAQERLLREILAGVRDRSIEAVEVVTPDPAWNLVQERSVQLNLSGPDDGEAAFERWLVAGAFVDRSHQEGLAPVGVVQVTDDGVRTEGPGQHVVRVPAIRPTPEGVERAAEQIRTAAAAARAGVQSIRVHEPDGGAIAVTLEVGDPPQFLAHRFERFEASVRQIWTRFPEGRLMRAVDDGGREIYLSYVAHRLGASSAGVPPELEGCISLGLSQPAGLEPPPPCPLG